MRWFLSERRGIESPGSPDGPPSGDTQRRRLLRTRYDRPLFTLTAYSVDRYAAAAKVNAAAHFLERELSLELLAVQRIALPDKDTAVWESVLN